MHTLKEMPVEGYERVLAFRDPAAGLRGFLAIHSTALGPAVGGVRLWRYASEDEALTDVLRLSRAMTYKAALAELPCGGGKAVIIAHPELQRDPAFEAYGGVVESLGGRFFTGPDVGIIPADLAAIARATHHVACGSAAGPDHSHEETALGVWHGMRACLDFAGLRRARPHRARVAIQGVGSVGLQLARLLKREGMELLVADIDPSRARQVAEELGAEVVPPDEILTARCDVLAPCALGGVITVETARQIQARIVCGCANNILATPEAGDELARRGILYAPDYLVNAGGLIAGVEFYLLKRRDSTASLARIYDRMQQVLELAQQRGVSTARVADELAEARLRAAER